jgi:catechol 2,3-dioxygenase-like lactoylglutathione lyase family enzyme
MIEIKQIHHVAYRCKNAKQTVEFYQKHLNLDLVVSIAEDKVPSTKKPNPYIHVFLDAGQGNILAFFEITGEKEMGRDLNTPLWVQHIALEVENETALNSAKTQLKSEGIDVLGVTDHGIIKSIYFFDPNGHRIELTCRTDTPGQLKNLKDVAQIMLEEWDQTKQPPTHTSWLHQNEFSKEV